MSRNRLSILISWILVICCAVPVVAQDKLQPGDMERARGMLSDLNDAIKKNYYDPKFHGLDLQARYKEALDRINKAQSFNQMLGIVAWFADGLDDSHTFLIPPQHAFHLDYGWREQMVGDKCLIMHVRPGSDAEAQKLTPGDQILTINGIKPTRDSLHKIHYLFNVLRPQPGLRLVVQTPTGEQRTLDIRAMIQPTRREITNYDEWLDEVRDYERHDELYDRKSVKVGDDVFVWKLYDFGMDEKGADNMMKDAKGCHGLVLDLRGNPGGSAEAVERMIGDLMDHDVKIADPEGRKKFDLPTTAKARNMFNGTLVVLIDSESASASEILAKVMQLNKRGTILGDRSAGAVMVAEHFGMKQGLNHTIFYGASVTKWNFVMEDGKSLENVGVTPDEVMVPTAEDLASGRDPVLAHAVEFAGGKISPEQAGKLFPFDWPPLK